MNIPSTVPEVFRAGDTVQWYVSLSDYSPDDGWTLSYTFTSIQGQFAPVAADNGDGRWLVTLSAADSAGVLDGTYTWTGAVTDAGVTQRFTVGQGTTTVLPDLLGSPAARDTRSHAQKVLDAIDAALLRRATTEQLTYSVGGVSLSYMTMAEMREAQSKYRFLVQQEEDAERVSKGLGTRRNILVRF